MGQGAYADDADGNCIESCGRYKDDEKEVVFRALSCPAC